MVDVAIALRDEEPDIDNHLLNRAWQYPQKGVLRPVAVMDAVVSALDDLLETRGQLLFRSLACIVS